ncbi:MAG: ADP-ribosylation factor-like protein, partial [Candidatus Hodarchaeales archaeon]
MSSGNSTARRIAFVGLHAAGKTSTLRRLVHGEFTPPRGPTMGFNVDSFSYRGISVQAFDLGGQ